MSPQSGATEQLVKLVDGSGTLTGWKLILPDDVTETYDETGRLVSLQNRAGLTQTVAYMGDLRHPTASPTISVTR